MRWLTPIGRSRSVFFSYNYAKGPGIRDNHDKAQADAQKAIALAPELAEGHLALAVLLANDLEFADAEHEYQRALTLEPGNARVLTAYGPFAVNMGHIEAGLAAVRRSVVLDPMNSRNHFSLGMALVWTEHFQEANAALTHAKALSPDNASIDSWLGFMYYGTGNLEAARTTCEGIKIAHDFGKLMCLVVTYEKLGRHTDAEAAFAQLRLSGGPQPAVIYAAIYAQRGDTARALDWLETAMRERDPGLAGVKTAPWLNPLRKEPRFQAIERELKFPN